MCFQFMYIFFSVLIVVLVIVLGISSRSRYGPPPEVKHFEESEPIEGSQTKDVK
ncbi:MAG: hypothetical protein SWQ30_02590 [Thermodesulfobacteriota bacterium]|nr:hypothetical protein [Thermodesulfobacteriota bacterium]